MRDRVWLAWRAGLALALLVGFYVLVLAVGLTLFWFAYAEIAYFRVVNPILVVGTIGAGVTVLWAALPRRDEFVAPGPRIVADDAPALFALVGEIARDTGQPPPEEVYVVGDVNAFVAQRSLDAPPDGLEPDEIRKHRLTTQL